MVHISINLEIYESNMNDDDHMIVDLKLVERLQSEEASFESLPSCNKDESNDTQSNGQNCADIIVSNTIKHSEQLYWDKLCSGYENGEQGKQNKNFKRFGLVYQNVCLKCWELWIAISPKGVFNWKKKDRQELRRKGKTSLVTKKDVGYRRCNEGKLWCQQRIHSSSKNSLW